MTIREAGIIRARESDIPRVLREARGSRVPRGRPKTEVGYTGLQVFGDLITGDIVEYNRDWQGKNRFTNADKMRKGDATCAATLMSMTLPIVSTEIIVDTREGADGRKPDPIVKEAADFIYWNLFENLSETWTSWLREAFLYLAYGHYAFEKIFEVIKEGPFKGMIGWREFAPRHPSTFEHYLFDRSGHLIGVEQQAFSPDDNSFKTVVIPLNKMIWFTNQKEAGNPLGVSVLRPAWKHFKYKDGFYAVQAIAVERQGAGVPFGKYPAGADDDDVTELEEMLQNIQAHEQSYMVFEDGWDVGFVDMGSQKVLDPKDAIEHHDQMIPKSILAGFLNLTQGDRGSFALSSDSSGFFTYTIQQTAGYIAGILTKAAHELLAINYPDLPAMPRLRFNKVGHISLEKIIDGIHKLGTQGFITPTLELENHVRNLLNLPPIDEEELEEQEERALKKQQELMAAKAEAGGGEQGGDQQGSGEKSSSNGKSKSTSESKR